MKTLVGLMCAMGLWLLSAQASAAAEAHLVLGGDVMLARGVDHAMRTHGPRHPWGDVLPLLREADLLFVNLECTIGRRGNPFMPRRVFYFRASELAADALAEAGIHGVSLANNHAMDYRAESLRETRRLLGERGILTVGAGEDLEDASRPVVLEHDGLRLAVVAFADHFAEYGATEAEPGINHVPVSLAAVHFDRVRAAVAAARATGADFVLFTMHWGPNMNHVPRPGFPAFARAVIDAGADIFHGHSAHVFQGIEFHGGGVILYDTGDLVDDYYVYPEHRNDQQLLFRIPLAAGRPIRRVELVPLLIADAQVNRATAADYQVIRERIARLSEPFGTAVHDEGGQLIAYPADGGSSGDDGRRLARRR